MAGGGLKLLMVCTGNICRSPTAQAVMQQKLVLRGLVDWQVDSAGVSGFHVGEPADRRSRAAAQRRGYDLSAIRARQVVARDFFRFDWILAMDQGHLQALQAQLPVNATAQLALMLAPVGTQWGRDVPDPYYGGEAGFEKVLDMLQAASAAWIDRLA